MYYVLAVIAMFMIFTLWCFLKAASRADSIRIK